MRHGQDLVLEIYKAIQASEYSDKILFLITYDEHGGFYDHVDPPTCKDDWPNCRRYGVRVPAIVISPFVEPGSSTDWDDDDIVFDHASIVKTILLKFCSDSAGQVNDWMSKRVMEANDLGRLLTRPQSSPSPPLDQFEGKLPLGQVLLQRAQSVFAGPEFQARIKLMSRQDEETGAKLELLEGSLAKQTDRLLELDELVASWNLDQLTRQRGDPTDLQIMVKAFSKESAAY